MNSHSHYIIIDLKLLQVIGKGNYGTVHKASWKGCLVAAKVLPIQNPEGSATLENEINALR